MKKIFRNIFITGRGITRITRADLEKIFDELKKRGEVEEKDREPFVNKALEKFEKSSRNVAKKIKGTFKEVIQPSKQKIEEINKKIEELVKEINELKKSEKSTKKNMKEETK